MICLLLYLFVLCFSPIRNESNSADILQTIKINENDMSFSKLTNLTEVLLNKKKLNESSLKNIQIVPLTDVELPPFKLQANQLWQPSSGVDRESVCSKKEIPTTLCSGDMCCKLIGFQYSIGSGIDNFFILIQISDQNDIIPQFQSIKRPYIKIAENTNIGYEFDLPMAVDSDSEQYSVLRYSISDVSKDFRLHVTGDRPPKPQLIVNSNLDYERTTKYMYILYAYDFAENSLGNSCSITIEIEIEDLNDNVPKFNQLSYNAEIDENLRNDRLIRFTVSDPDSGRNGLVMVTIQDKNDEILKKFQIFESQRNEGYLGLINPLDYEVDPHSYEITLIATDQGTPSLSSTAEVRIHLKNVNDNGPKIKFKKLGSSTSNSVSIREGLSPHSLVVEVRVTDADSNINMLNCRLIDHSELFYLENLNKFNTLLNYKPYYLKTMIKIDRESSYGSFIRITISCTDGDHYKSLTTNESLSIQIEDENDNQPVFPQQMYLGTVEENQANVFVNFAKPITVTDRDFGQNAKFEFHLEDFPAMNDSRDFIVEPSSGRILTQKSLDYELINIFRFKIVVVDKGDKPLSSSATVTIHVRDLNDNAPKFQRPYYEFHVNESVAIGTKIGSIVATDDDTDKKNKDIIYSIESKNDNSKSIEVDSATGSLRTKESLDREKFESIAFKVIARNPNSYSSQTLRTSESEADIMIRILDINDNPPEFRLRPNTKPKVEFIIEQYLEGTTCTELPYTVHDADDGDTTGQNCCTTKLENNYNNLLSLMTDTPSFICLSKKPEKYQSLSVTLIATDKPKNPAEALSNKVTFQVIIKNDPNRKGEGRIGPEIPPRGQPGINDSKNLIIIGILTTVLFVVIIIIIIIIIIIRRCSIPDRECDTSKCYQAIDPSINRPEGTKVNYMMSEQGSMIPVGLSPTKSTISRGYLQSPQYMEHKTLPRTMQHVPLNMNMPFTPSTYHQILTTQGVRILQNPNRFNDQNIYEWSPVLEDRERTINRNPNSFDKMRSMSPTKSGSIHTSSKMLNEDQLDSGYQILNPFGTSSSPQQNFVSYSPEILIPCENDISPIDSRSLTLLNNFFDDNNNSTHNNNNNNSNSNNNNYNNSGTICKTTPRTMKKNYFQTTFV